MDAAEKRWLRFRERRLASVLKANAACLLSKSTRADLTFSSSSEAPTNCMMHRKVTNLFRPFKAVTDDVMTLVGREGIEALRLE